MAELGPTTIFGDLVTNGSLGGAVRLAYCQSDAGAFNYISCYLDIDGTGELVTVQCLTGQAGVSLLNASVPRLSDGDPLLVIKHNDTWYSATIFEDSEDFDEGVAMPKLKYISGKTLVDASAIPTSLSGSQWGVSKSIIKAIKVQTNSTDWDLVLWASAYASDVGMYDNGFIDLALAADGDKVLLLDLPYIDYDSGSSVHLQFIDNAGYHSAIVDIYGVEART